ncbi:MAG: SxtJ family membrane protein [Bacteroidetes bacterium]|nr:SxtJ family membrane protein [Bacteroidota bacterium]
MIKALLSEIRLLWSRTELPASLERGFLGVMTGIPAAILAVRFWLHGWQGFWDWFWTGWILLFLVLFPIKSAFRFCYNAWMSVGFILGFFVSNLILTLIFYGVLSPVGFYMRLRGKDPLLKKPDNRLKSYWETPHPQKPESWKNQW